jgi:abhydrolase domain-containing protein 13
VPVPTDFGLPYEDVELITPDNVRIKCYLMIQRNPLDIAGMTEIDIPEGKTDEEVSCFGVLCLFSGAS